ncbi:hypothetical protein RCL1_002459 [Eukaryota sp. TZLM3-RCL]
MVYYDSSSDSDLESKLDRLSEEKLLDFSSYLNDDDSLTDVDGDSDFTSGTEPDTDSSSDDPKSKTRTPTFRRYFSDANDSLYCRRCCEPGHTMSTCPYEGSHGCFLCGREGHIKNDCPFKVDISRTYGFTCYKCQGAHLPWLCSGDFIPNCFNCTSASHYSYHCDEEQKPCYCLKCGKNGHVMRECPKQKLDLPCTMEYNLNLNLRHSHVAPRSNRSLHSNKPQQQQQQQDNRQHREQRNEKGRKAKSEVARNDRQTVSRRVNDRDWSDERYSSRGGLSTGRGQRGGRGQALFRGGFLPLDPRKDRVVKTPFVSCGNSIRGSFMRGRAT